MVIFEGGGGGGVGRGELGGGEDTALTSFSWSLQDNIFEVCMFCVMSLSAFYFYHCS